MLCPTSNGTVISTNLTCLLLVVGFGNTDCEITNPRRIKVVIDARQFVFGIDLSICRPLKSPRSLNKRIILICNLVKGKFEVSSITK